MDEKTKAVHAMPCDTTAEILEKVAQKIGLQSVEGWALYEVSEAQDIILNSSSGKNILGYFNENSTIRIFV